MRLREEPLHVRIEPKLRIISDALWSKVQKQLIARAHASHSKPRGGRPVGSSAKYLLSGLLQCGQCGSNFTSVNRRSYACSGYLGGRLCSGHFHYVPSRVIEGAILHSLDADLPALSAAISKHLLTALMTAEKPERAESREQLALAMELTKLGSRVVVGDATPADLRRIAELTEQRKQLVPSRTARARKLSNGEAHAVIETLLKRIPQDAARVRELAIRDVPTARALLKGMTGTIRLVELKGETKTLRAEYDLGIDPLLSDAKPLKSHAQCPS